MAAENAPGSCAVAGPFDAIEAFQAQLEADGIACRALRTSHAFHSAMMAAVAEPFHALVDAPARSLPPLSIVATVSGDWLDAGSATSPHYPARQLPAPIRLSPALP